MYYFGYGSNMLKERLENQSRHGQIIGTVVDHGISTLKNFHIKFNKKSSRDGSGKTNIHPKPGSEVLGVLYEMTDQQLNLLTSVEVGYKIQTVMVNWNGQIIEAITYIGEEDCLNEGILPTFQYLNYLIEGANEHNFPLDYVSFLESHERI